MRRHVVVLLAAAALPLVAQSAGSYTPAPTAVRVDVPDGGLPVNLASQEVRVATPDGGLPVNFGAQALRVLAPDGGLPVATQPGSFLAVAGDSTGAPLRTETTGLSGQPLEANVLNRVDANVSTAPGSFLAVAADVLGTRLAVDVANTPAVTVSGTPSVTIAGTVALSSASLTSISAATAERVCTYAVGAPDSLTISTTPANIPASPLTGRTAITIENKETVRELWCNPAGTASASAAFPIPPNGSTQKFEGLNGAVVSCRCSVSTCAYSYLEERCIQPSP
jgi:hypothetical protein